MYASTSFLDAPNEFYVYFFDAPFNFTDAQKFNENFTEWQNHGKDAHSLVAPNDSGAPTLALDPASPAVVAEGFVPIAGPTALLAPHVRYSIARGRCRSLLR